MATLLDERTIAVRGDAEIDDDRLEALGEELQRGLEAVAVNLREKFGVQADVV